MTIITSRNAPIDIYMEALLVGLSREKVHPRRPIVDKTNDQESQRDAWSLVRYKCAMIRYEKPSWKYSEGSRVCVPLL